MRLDQFITCDVKPFEVDVKIAKIRSVFKLLKSSHIPIQKHGIFLGCLSEKDINAFDENVLVNDVLYCIETFFVKKNSIWLNILDAFVKNETNIMPVLDSKNDYLGYYKLSDLLFIFKKTHFFSEPGGIIVIEKASKDYSFSEICQILESNNAKLLGVFVSRRDETITQLTIKTERSGLSAVFEALRRYEYTILLGNENDDFLEILKDRSAYLNRYLNP